MSDIDEQAFTIDRKNGGQYGGLSKREYAAIHMRVPESGNAELDAMIRTAMRDELAKASMQAIISDPTSECGTNSLGTWAYTDADAMLAEREKKA